MCNPMIFSGGVAGGAAWRRGLGKTAPPRRQNARSGGEITAAWMRCMAPPGRKLPGVIGGWGGVRRAGRRPAPVFSGWAIRPYGGPRKT